MGKKKKELSHAEVWDDSALLQSWDDALAEYKLYHSIHARGEHVEDVIKNSAENTNVDMNGEEPSTEKASNSVGNGTTAEEMEDGELEWEAASASAVENGDSSAATKETTATNPRSQPEPSAPVERQHAAHGMPNVIIDNVQDEALKNLMMSWYHAGYYTGLYEGRRQTQNPV